MNRCKDCKHFEWMLAPVGLGTCNRWEIGYHDFDLKPDECQVEGDEGWGMMMGPEFGCVLWETK